MNKEIKYTSDGRKVIVIGSLNSQEKIVQEIFIIDGSEIPSGEHFTTKSLHDAPAISWKEKNLKELEERYDREKRDYDFKIDKLNKDFRDKSALLKEKIQWAANAVQRLAPESFNTLYAYLSGEIKYIVEVSYGPQLKTWDEFKQQYENRLRLLSWYGNDDGSMTYGVNVYYDYSGGTTQFKPFVNHSDAIDCLTKELIKNPLTDHAIKEAQKHNIVLPQNMIEEYVSKKIDGLQSNIKKSNEDVAKYQQAIDQISLLNQSNANA